MPWKFCYNLQSGDVFSIFSKDEVTGSGFSEGRGARFVVGREKDPNDNFKREPIAKETVSGKEMKLRIKFESYTRLTCKYKFDCNSIRHQALRDYMR